MLGSRMVKLSARDRQVYRARCRFAFHQGGDKKGFEEVEVECFAQATEHLNIAAEWHKSPSVHG